MAVNRSRSVPALLATVLLGACSAAPSALPRRVDEGETRQSELVSQDSRDDAKVSLSHVALSMLRHVEEQGATETISPVLSAREASGSPEREQLAREDGSGPVALSPEAIESVPSVDEPSPAASSLDVATLCASSIDALASRPEDLQEKKAALKDALPSCLTALHAMVKAHLVILKDLDVVLRIPLEDATNLSLTGENYGDLVGIPGLATFVSQLASDRSRFERLVNYVEAFEKERYLAGAIDELKAKVPMTQQDIQDLYASEAAWEVQSEMVAKVKQRFEVLDQLAQWTRVTSDLNVLSEELSL